MFIRLATVLTFTSLVSLGSWGTISTTQAQTQQSIAQQSIAQQSIAQSRRWNRPRPRLRPHYTRQRRAYRRHPSLYQTRSRRLSFRVGARRFYGGSYIGGISRNSNCPTGNVQLERLVAPEQASARAAENASTAQQLPTDRTISARPTFFAVLPQLPPGTAELTLQYQDQNQGQDLYLGEFEITGQPGIVGVQLPDSAPALEVGKAYRWQMAVRCDPDNDENQWVIVEGGIERVAETHADASDVAAAYADQGIWQDVLEMMAMLRYEKPDDSAIARAWSDLMTSAQLPQFADMPVVQIEVSD